MHTWVPIDKVNKNYREKLVKRIVRSFQKYHFVKKRVFLGRSLVLEVLQFR